MAVINVTDTSFSKDVLDNDGLVLVDFWAPWCGPCKMIAPVLDDLAATGAKVVKVNIDDEPQTPAQYGVRSIPTLMLFKNGESVDTKVGLQSKGQLEAWMGQFA